MSEPKPKYVEKLEFDLKKIFVNVLNKYFTASCGGDANEFIAVNDFLKRESDLRIQLNQNKALVLPKQTIDNILAKGVVDRYTVLQNIMLVETSNLGYDENDKTVILEYHKDTTQVSKEYYCITKFLDLFKKNVTPDAIKFAYYFVLYIISHRCFSDVGKKMPWLKNNIGDCSNNYNALLYYASGEDAHNLERLESIFTVDLYEISEKIWGFADNFKYRGKPDPYSDFSVNIDGFKLTVTYLGNTIIEQATDIMEQSQSQKHN